MYDKILRGCLTSLSIDVHKLIIIPDGVLNYIPFEMLSPEKPTSFKNASFLIKNYTISYGASANLLIEQAKKSLQNTAQESFVGFAPSYRNQKAKNEVYVMRAVTTRDSAYDLPGATEEVQKIHEIVGGKTFMSDDANVAQFKKTAPHFKILHLAMHGLIDENNPSNNRLLFTKNPADTLNDNELTAAELNTMTLHADLAVLSACNTGFGKLSKGEGVMSVARAFNYAGVPSTVMSLWIADDNETSGIMIDFYKNLKMGMPKDEALRQAKLTYLDKAKLDDKAAPFFWAAFVLSGNTEGVSFDTPLPMWAYGCIGFVALVSLLLFFKFRKRI
jgi:CHAT domain-containing protein